MRSKCILALAFMVVASIFVGACARDVTPLQTTPSDQAPPQPTQQIAEKAKYEAAATEEIVIDKEFKVTPSSEKAAMKKLSVDPTEAGAFCKIACPTGGESGIVCPVGHSCTCSCPGGGPDCRCRKSI